MPNKSFVEAIFLKENSELSNSILGPFGALREKRIQRMGLNQKKIITLSQIKDTLPEFKGLIISEAKRKLLVSLFALLTNTFDGPSAVESAEAINTSIAANVQRLGEIRQVYLSNLPKSPSDDQFIYTFLLPTIDYTALSKEDHAHVVKWLREGFEKFGVSGEDGKITILGFAYKRLPECLKNQISEKNYTSLYQKLASTNIIFTNLSKNQDEIQNLKEFSKDCPCEIPGFISLCQLCKDIVEVLRDNNEIRPFLTEDMSTTLYDRYCNLSRDIFYFSLDVAVELLQKIRQNPAQAENIFKQFCEDINSSETKPADNASKKGRHSRRYFSLSSSDPSSTKEK